MFKRELGLFVFVFGVAASAVACGGPEYGELQIDTVVRGEDPACGMACPPGCWVELSTPSGQIGKWWIFDAEELPETPLRQGVATLIIPGESTWTKEIADVVEDPVQHTVYGTWSISSSFDIYDPEVVASVVLGSPESPITCGLRVD